eukprot:COSAG01_NODE_23512_length_808_cov_1.782609_1_plen_39_part_10
MAAAGGIGVAAADFEAPSDFGTSFALQTGMGKGGPQEDV